MPSNIIVKIKGTNMVLTPAIEDYVRKKTGALEKFLNYYTQESGELLFEVEIEKTTLHHKKGEVFRAEINFTAGKTLFRAEEESDDLYAAIDAVQEGLRRELQKGKNKAHALLKRSGAAFKALFRRWYE